MTSSFTVDVLVVGAGPAGAVAAHSLAQNGHRVVCLEQGDWTTPPGPTPAHQILQDLRNRVTWNWDPNVRRNWSDYPVTVDEAAMPALMYSAVGGSTLVFGGQWHRFQPGDFQVHSRDGVADDWPIDYEDLEPYYKRTDEMVGVAGLFGDIGSSAQEPPLPPHPIGVGGLLMASAMDQLGWHWWPGRQAIASARFGSMAQCARWGVCERGCPVGAKSSFDLSYWPAAVRAGVQLLTRARVCRITTNKQGYADGVIWIDSEGVSHRVRANAVVLAANGIGTPRLMLMSDDGSADGLGNSSGLVGKNLMMHPTAVCTGAYDRTVEGWNGPAGELLYSMQFYDSDPARGFLRGAKWSLTPVPGVLSALELFKDRSYECRWGPSVHELSRHAGRLLAWQAFVDDLPDERNCVTLDTDLLDDSGLPAARIVYELSENSRRNLEFSLHRMSEAHRAAGATDTFAQAPMPSGHLLGTVRMGTDPATSVVDPYGRSHDVPNLFVADGSVMVTGSGVNPTSTIAAIALRTAEHIHATAKGQPAQV